LPGIYIHVPFCRQACRYCDFYFTVSLKYKEDYIEALKKEIELRSAYVESREIDTIYFGGGTPSVLSVGQIQDILDMLLKKFSISPDVEFTLEANPDDLTKAYLKKLKQIGVNRLSVGVQSFHQDELSLMRRSHTEAQAQTCIQNAANAGFSNINLDLIYGVPGLTMKKWEENVRTVMQLPVVHISAYHLSYEEGTVFDHWRKKGKLFEVEETISIAQFQLLKEITADNGFEHYEISNFAKEGKLSRHNTAYWESKEYLGLGPSAHSFNGTERSWNVSSVKKYIDKIRDGEDFLEREVLKPKDRFNDYLIVSLRTKRGVDMNYIKSEFGESRAVMFLKSAEKFMSEGVMIEEGERMRIDDESWIRADMIIREMIVG